MLITSDKICFKKFIFYTNFYRKSLNFNARKAIRKEKKLNNQDTEGDQVFISIIFQT